MKQPSASCLLEYGINTDNYLLSIARLEPENNLEMMFDAYITCKIPTPYFVVGNHLTSYGDFFNKNEMVFYKNISDLSEKILKISRDEKLRRSIGRRGKEK